MKRLLLSALLSATPLLGVAQFNFNFSIGDPGYYGQLYYDNSQAPLVMNTTPIIAYPNASDIYVTPIYLRVPPYYYQNWTQFCGMYNACYTPVFFVQDDWYQHFYIPWYRNRYPYNIPKYLPWYHNRYPYDVPKYLTHTEHGPYIPRGGNMWHGGFAPRFDNRGGGFVERRDESRMGNQLREFRP